MKEETPWQLRVFSVSVRKQEKWAWIRGALQRFDMPRGNCLDVGCGVGTISMLLKDRGGTWSFLEPDPDAAREATALLGCPVLQTTIEEQQYPSGSFDLVTAFDVIEHVTDVPRFLGEVARVLAPGGVFLATTPSAGEEKYVWRRIGERVFGITKEAHGHAVEGFSHARLDALLRAAGLTPKALASFSRFFTEGMELAYNGAYHLRNARRQRTRGYNLALSPASPGDVIRHARALAVLRVVAPALRGLSRLDHVVPIGPGYEVGIVAEKPGATVL